MVIEPHKAWALSQLLFEEVLRQLDGHFSKINIRFMPIKGAYLIRAGLADRLTYRRMNDIDILLLPSDFPVAKAYFASLGNVEFRDNYWPFEASFYYKIGNARVFIELHNQLNWPERFILPSITLFLRAGPGGGACVLPSTEDSLIIFLCHMFVHIPFEIRDTDFDEIGIFCGQDGFLWEKFWENARHTGIEQFFYVILKLFNTRKKSDIPLVSPTRYAALVSKIISIQLYEKMPVWLRRITLELPFAASPLSLMTKKKLFA